MKVAIVFGTRPEIIKLGKIIKRLSLLDDIEFISIHTGQHYDYNMYEMFFEEIGIPPPNYNLGISSLSHGSMVGNMMIEIEKIFYDFCPDFVIVQGDTNSSLAGALVSSKMNIKLAHVEAGLRSFDKSMPEEINRIVIDHIADFCFAPSKIQLGNLVKEGVDKSNIYVVGNTVVDILIESSFKPVEDYNNYIYLTFHRQGNTKSRSVMLGILNAVSEISEKLSKKVIFPIHPRTRKLIQEFGLDNNIQGFTIIDPVGYETNLSLIKSAGIIITDSGGIQEEGFVLGKKMLILRYNTERPEALKDGHSMLCGNSTEMILFTFSNLDWSIETIYNNEIGDGTSSEQIINYLKHNFKGLSRL